LLTYFARKFKEKLTHFDIPFDKDWRELDNLPCFDNFDGRWITIPCLDEGEDWIFPSLSPAPSLLLPEKIQKFFRGVTKRCVYFG
jgi:hypothetical protein